MTAHTEITDDGPEIILDLSRLLSRVLHPTPTGIDRCEMAYARGLMTLIPDRIRFAAVHPIGVYGRLPADDVLRFLDATERRWEHVGWTGKAQMRRRAIPMLTALWPRPVIGHKTIRPIYLLASPNNLTKPKLVGNILQRERARFACLIHDVIPLHYPEYSRPTGAAQHRIRVETIARLADAVIANSHATLGAFRPFLEAAGRSPLTGVAHLGAHSWPSEPSAATRGRPYFVCIGTIEPRKNHLLLLNLWRRMAEERGAGAIPKLLIIGRRGWENEQVVDMLERCPSLVDCVEELNGLPDVQVHTLLAHAQGLLLPSFAEGYGMPVVEALGLGVPVVCSDLPALREAGGDQPLFLDPLDGPAWAKAIDMLTTSAPRNAFLEGRATRPLTSWAEHLAIVIDLLHRLPR